MDVLSQMTCRDDIEGRSKRATRKSHWSCTAAVALAIGAAACGGRDSFRNETPSDTAACRNVAREVTGDSWGRNYDGAYNDCMLSRGYQPTE
jgi:hypothetical protein